MYRITPIILNKKKAIKLMINLLIIGCLIQVHSKK